MQGVTLDTSERQLPSINRLCDSGETMQERAARSIRPHAAPPQPVPLTLIIKTGVCSRQSAAVSTTVFYYRAYLKKYFYICCTRL